MKFDSNHIDDVFKDGLKDYSEQPSPESWKKISSRILWDDIIHLRFGNIPKMWLATAAGIVILAVVLSLWITSGGNETETSAMEPEKVVTAPQQKRGQTRMDEASLTLPTQDVSIVSPEQQQTETSSSLTVPGAFPSGSDAGDQLIADKPDHKISITSEAGREQAKTNHSAAAVGEPDQITRASGTEPETGYTETREETISAQQPAESQQAIKTADQTETGKESSVASSVAVVTNESQAASQFSGEIVKQESENMAPAQSGINGEESQLANQERPVFLDGNRSSPPPQKIPEIDVLSFATTKPGNGNMKPSERTSGNMPGFLYGGYQPYFSVSAYFAPEVTEYHRIASESKESSYLGGVALSYNTENYVIQAGLEISRFNDLGDYLVNIHSYDSIGYYNGVSGFEVDPENPGELIFHTHTVEVWDTVQHHSHEQTRNSYTYLQIPVMVGYKAVESGIFSAHIKAGPSFSFLLNRREPGLEFHASGNARVAGIDNFTAPRIETNVQVLVSLALQLQFTEKLGLLVEPAYRYYLNPVYDVNNESLKNPYGIGVRGGVFFNF